MKFLKDKAFYMQPKTEYHEYYDLKLGDNYFYYDFYKYFIKKRKNISKPRIGIINKIKNSSLYRNKNKDILKQYANISQKKGKFNNFYKNINLSIENLFFIFGNESDEFKKYKNYMIYFYYYNISGYYSDINVLLNLSINDLESIFEIKTIKNSKRMKSPNKYSHEIIYIPPKKRFKYILRSLSFYKESFKNYNLWERIFWSFLLTIINKNNSFLKKRRDYIYSKSVKFFKRKKK